MNNLDNNSANKENTLVCSLKWGNQENCKNSFFPFEKQCISNKLNFKVFNYDSNEENAIKFREKFNLMGEYIYFKIFKFYEDLKKEIKITQILNNIFYFDFIVFFIKFK